MKNKKMKKRLKENIEIKDKYIYHVSSSIITELRPSPMWFSFSEKIAEGYLDFSDGSLKYVHKYKLTGGNFMSLEEVKAFCNKEDIDYDKMESEIRDNPDNLFGVKGLNELKDICDGFVHNDFSPLDEKKDIKALLIFDPTSNLELIDINNVLDKEDGEGVMTDAGVVMGKKLTEGIIRDYMLFLVEKINDSYKKGDIRDIFGPADRIDWRSDMARVKALLYIYDFQTEDEQSSQSTNHHNNMGFTGSDANILSSFAKQVISKGWLSDKQMELLRRKIIKYAGQIARVANEAKINGKDQYIKSQFDKWVNNNRNKYSREITEANNKFSSPEFDKRVDKN